MSDWFLAAVGSWGIPALALATFLSCLAVPLPSSMMMLAAGAFAASGDLVLWQVMAAALTGALIGDQLGYAAGRLGGPSLVARLSRAPQRATLVRRAPARTVPQPRTTAGSCRAWRASWGPCTRTAARCR